MLSVSDRDLRKSLFSDTCPACGGKKIPHRPLCLANCWKRLPLDVRNALMNKPIGRGFEGAMEAAMELLGKEYFIAPQPPRRRTETCPCCQRRILVVDPGTARPFFKPHFDVQRGVRCSGSLVGVKRLALTPTLTPAVTEDTNAAGRE